MAALGNYTTTEAVRGCLGVDPNDCPDSLMIDSRLDLELKVNLGGWLPDHATLYAAGTASGAPAEAEAISDRLVLYSQWFCALEVANRPMTVPQITTDGKAQIDRFKVDLKRVSDLCAAKVAQYRSELEQLVNGETPVVAGLPTTLLTTSLPDADPITEGLQ